MYKITDKILSLEDFLLAFLWLKNLMYVLIEYLLYSVDQVKDKVLYC